MLGIRSKSFIPYTLYQDNAPHHKELETYPDHVHVGESVYPHIMHYVNLKHVLEILEAEIER